MPGSAALVLAVCVAAGVGCNGRVVTDSTGDAGGLAAETGSVCDETDLDVDACSLWPGKPRRFVCDRLPEGCGYLLPDCTNCIEFCCADAPTAAMPRVIDAGAARTSPPGCARRPSEDWTCVAQAKAPHAFRCDHKFARDDAGFPTYPRGCIPNPYGDEGRLCTVESDGLACAEAWDLCCE